MTQRPSAPRRRSRVSEQAQHLYMSRGGYSMEEAPCEEQSSLHLSQTHDDYEPMQPSYDAYAANEEAYAEEPVQPVPDYAAYYSREGVAAEESQGPAFAAPVHLNYYGYESQMDVQEEAVEEEPLASNVYRPRKATWADEARQEALAQSELGYQVRADEAPVRKKRKKKKRRHTLRNILVALAALSVLAAATFILWQPVMEWLKEEEILPTATEEPFRAVVTPEPIKAYDAAPIAEMADATEDAIRQLSGSLKMEPHIVTDAHVVTRNQRADGSYDFYLFTAPQGRLLCYFEGLGPQDMIPLEGGAFYVNQAPYLIAPSGSALIRTASIEAAIGESMRLHPLYHGWAVVESEEDGSANYISQSGQVLSTLWFSRTFPFTGEYTLAYVDTGSTADEDQRYLLYVLGTDGTMSRWLATAHMEDVVAAACGMAYMANGDLYALPDTSAPVLNSPHIDAYLDCDAMVVQDGKNGKYGLLVHGEKHYDFVYDAIRPVESDITWGEKTLSASGAAFTVHAVEGESYPQPLSHSFVLEKDGQCEYVALSTSSSYPIRLDGEF